MKKYGALIALFVAVIFGSLAVMLANRWLASQQVVPQETRITKIPTADIVVAAQDIDIGAPLSTANLALAPWPKANQPKGAFTDMKQLEGRIAVTKLVAGEPLLAAELAPAGSGAGLVALIPKGMRAMSIRVDEVIGVAGFVLPNTFVDIIGVNKEQGKASNAKTILKQIKVLAIAQETFTEEGKAKVVRTVTLQVTPEEGEKLALQTHEGGIHLVLRNPLEEETPKQVVAEKPAVKKKSSRPHRVPVLKARVSVPEPQPFNVEVLRGSEKSQLRFKNAESSDEV